MNLSDKKIGIIGLGYVGLPLAVEFGKKYNTVGFDINQARVDELNKGEDSTLEVEPEYLKLSDKLVFTTNLDDVKDCSIYIVTVPTPIDQNKRPDLSPLEKSSAAIGSVLKPGDIVIYESTVFPGCTEEVCVPLLESTSGLVYNQGFYCGYSPERINPGDKVHTVTKIMKVTSGSTPEVSVIVDELYKSIITAGTFRASSIKVAEASKVIENCQRDLNISFVNELALIFDRVGIDTLEVLEAAGSKWNFLPFRPGLVGGHCISVDPYYLTHKAQQLGYYPEVILSGRRINENMGAHVAKKVVKMLIQNGHMIKGASILILGITFKENCPDIRNSGVVDIINEFEEFGTSVEVHDPWVLKDEVKNEYGISVIDNVKNNYAAIVHAVSHDQFKELDLRSMLSDGGIIYDVKSSLPKELVDERL
ncbi:nucleotide sugar dehydrogenase [Bacteroidia bacterium]|nr:nucleotide sugar dehydrogenase [Bacteroidia bacterium]